MNVKPVSIIVILIRNVLILMVVIDVLVKKVLMKLMGLVWILTSVPLLIVMDFVLMVTDRTFVNVIVKTAKLKSLVWTV